MFDMITVDLREAVRPIQFHEEQTRALPWQSSGKLFDRASLVTPGPQHAELIVINRPTQMRQIADELKIWYEPSLVLVLQGCITHEFYENRKNSGVFGWQKVFPNFVALLPPEASHPRYHAPRGPKWEDPSVITFDAGTVMLLATPGTAERRNPAPLSLDLSGCIGHMHLKGEPVRLTHIDALEADAAVERVEGRNRCGIYRHHGTHPVAFKRGMIELELYGPSEDDSNVHRDLVLYGPDQPVPATEQAYWSFNAMFG